MGIEAISSNTFVQQVGGGLLSKQVQNSDQKDDANVTATLEGSQNIGKNSVRNVEQGAKSNSGSGVNDNNEPQKQIEEEDLLNVLA